LRGKTVVSRKPAQGNRLPTTGQLSHRARFRNAAAYGRFVTADAELRQVYDEAAKRKDMPVFALIVADYMRAPSLGNVDVAGYNGNPGESIHIIANDDFGVVSVHVSITDMQGNPIENGNAAQTTDGMGRWVYTTKASTSADVTIQVVATDRPGGTAVQSFTKNL
jgi:hypothetical protein